MRAISVFRPEAGMSTVSCAAWMPLRMRVRKSATGSVIDMRVLLPARLRHAGHVAVVRHLAQADAAQAELAVDRARPAAAAAAGVLAGLVLRGACLTHALGRLGHASGLLVGIGVGVAGLALDTLARGGLGLGVGVGVLLLELLERGLLGLRAGVRLVEALLLLGLRGARRLLLGAGAALLGERHAERLEQRERLEVGLRRRGDRDVEAADLVDGVVVDLGEDDLLADADGVVAAAVERRRLQAAEVADPRDRDRHQAVEELVRALVAQRDRDADRHALAQLEVRDRLAGPADAGLLAGDRAELLLGGLEDLGVLLAVADAHVQRDLLDAGSLHRGRVAEPLDETLADLVVVADLQACGCACVGGHGANRASSRTGASRGCGRPRRGRCRRAWASCPWDR